MIPEHWDGVFFDDLDGSVLFEEAPEEFLARLAGMPEDYQILAAASAYSDLAMNGEKERAERFISVARDRWPHRGIAWAILPAFCRAADQYRTEHPGERR